jgi:hypothetical protein
VTAAGPGWQFVAGPAAGRRAVGDRTVTVTPNGIFVAVVNLLPKPPAAGPSRASMLGLFLAQNKTIKHIKFLFNIVYISFVHNEQLISPSLCFVKGINSCGSVEWVEWCP